MRAIVTGATGFIGKWLVQELLNNGYEVTIIIRNMKYMELDKVYHRCDVIIKDLNDLSAKDFDQSYTYDVFYNVAWDGVSPEQKNNFDKQIHNIPMLIRLLEVCNDLSCKLFISTGTVAEYALTTDVMDLTSKQSPNDMYGAAKVAAHYFLSVRARQLGQKFIWCVLPSTYGEGRISNNIITYTIKTLLKGEKPLYGNLLQMWDFLYVSEVARALRLIGEKGKCEKVYGIGSGEYKPLKDYITTIRNCINPKLELGIGLKPDYSKMAFSSCVNIHDLTEDTGFIPKIGFEEGIRKTIDYYKNGLM